MQGKTLVVTLALAGSFLLRPAAAHAVDVSASLKGITGCALLGAELPLIGMSLAGVRNPWVLGLVPVATGIGGGFAGYFLIEQNHQTELAVGSLVLGMALIIPTIGVVVNATRYNAEDRDVIEIDERTPAGEAEGAADTDASDGQVGGGFQLGGSSGGSDSQAEDTPAAPERRPRAPDLGASLLRLDPGAVAFGMPLVGVAPTDGATAVVVSLASGTF